MIAKCLNRLARVIEIVIGILFLILTIVVVAEIFSRYVLGNSIKGSFELARYLVIWLCFLGTSQGIRRAELINITIVKNALPPQLAKAVTLTTMIFMAAFLLLIIRYGSEVVYAVIPQMSPSLNVSMAYPYLALPVGSFLMLIFLVEAFVKILKQ